MMPDDFTTRLTRMVEIPWPTVGNVTLVISDGTGYISCEVTMQELIENNNDITEALNYLRAELINVDRPNERLRRAMDSVVEFRNIRDKDG